MISESLFAFVLIVATGLYMFLRWRHSPKAFKAMTAVSITSLVAGSILGACVYRLTEQKASTAVPRPLALLRCRPPVSHR